MDAASNFGLKTKLFAGKLCLYNNRKRIMDVSSVKDRPVSPTQQPKRTEQAHSEAAKPRAAEAKKAPEAKPMPVVNSQGQTTGRHLNVTA
jgi:hypothetical protein